MPLRRVVSDALLRLLFGDIGVGVIRVVGSVGLLTLPVVGWLAVAYGPEFDSRVGEKCAVATL